MERDGPDKDNPRTNGLIFEFFINYFDIGGEDFHLMIKEAINEGRLQARMTKGLITVSHK